jgi:hypothetical protein
MFPLRKRQLIRGCQAHINAGLGCAADYEANYAPFYIPFNGKVETYWGTEGGNWLRLIRPNGDKIELAHNSKYAIKPGDAVAGQLGGTTGNTGSITTRPHLHIQIFNKSGKRLNPETYDWGDYMNPNIKTQKKGTELSINIPAQNWEDFVALCKYFGKDPNSIDTTIN